MRLSRLFSAFCAATGTLVLAAGLTGCGSDPTPEAPDPTPVVERYAEMVHDNYELAISGVVTLDSAVQTLVASPSEQGLTDARDAWINCRGAYGESEVYRFYGGPIDDGDGPEGRINAWPLDEAFIDYVEGDPGAGIINLTAQFPEITKDLLLDQNEKGGEKNIATGYHSIEFLLWGQDRSASGPGERPFTDYLTDGSGTAENQDRRAAYLTLATALLLEDLESVEAEWEPGADNYRASFVKDPQAALGNMLKGMGSLAGAELSRERMNNALQEQDQEEEHSCFSDNTATDLAANAIGLQNVYLGRFGAKDGPGLDELVKAVDPDLDTRIQAELADAIDKIDLIPRPFDQAITSDDGRTKIQAAIDALQKVTGSIVDVAAALEVNINLEE